MAVIRSGVRSVLSKNVLPLGIIVFAVTGFILIGLTTPSEAAAWGTATSFILATCYRSVNWEMVKKTLASTLNIAVMMFMIFLGAIAFSQILAFSGATKALVELTTGLHVAPILIIIFMQIVVLFLGMFIEQTSIMIITLPIFMPIVEALGFNDVWFGMIMLINLGIANRTPPFGFLLFVLKGVSSSDTTMGDIYRAAIPYIICDMLVMSLILVFPALALWLPGVMR